MLGSRLKLAKDSFHEAQLWGAEVLALLFLIILLHILVHRINFPSINFSQFMSLFAYLKLASLGNRTLISYYYLRMGGACFTDEPPGSEK